MTMLWLPYAAARELSVKRSFFLSVANTQFHRAICELAVGDALQSRFRLKPIPVESGFGWRDSAQPTRQDESQSLARTG
jgi:hypothetical protein